MMLEPQASGFRLKIEFAQASDPGRDPNKQVNEDSCGYAETRFGHLCVLCDGMGGHYGGKEASRCAITTIFEMFEQLPPGMAPAAALKQAIEEAGRRVYQLGGPPENRTRPGSTVVVMLLHDRGLDVAHVGDSRAYIIRSNQIYPLTRDHSMVQGMIDAGMLTEESAMGHPDSNKITRALGMKPDVDVELRPEPMELFPGDVLLQSSDGLTDLALGRDILGATRQALSSGNVEYACNTLVKLANDRGGHDNITVQMVRVGDVGSKVVTTIPERPPGAAGGAPPATAAGIGPGHEAHSAPKSLQGTMQMTSPVGGASGPSYLGNQMSPASQGGAGGQPWPAVLPTAPDQTPAPKSISFGPPPMASQGAPNIVPAAPISAPTLNDMPAQGQAPAQPWTSGQFNPVPGAGSPGPALPPSSLQPYRLDAGPGALPLPPASARPYGAQGPQPGYGSTPLPGPGLNPSGFPQPAPGGFAPPGAMAGPMSAAPVQASKGGLVFLIIGMSAVIAILILVVVWALVLR
jgi:serine/threonine protein phosphatase PrpC